MTGGDGARERVRALLLRAADHDPKAFGLLAQELLASVERGIRAALKAYDLVDSSGNSLDAGGEEDAAFLDFLDRLKTDKFRAQLADANDPHAYSFETARRLTSDRLAKQPALIASTHEPALTQTASDSRTDAALSSSASKAEARTHLSEVLGDLSLEETVLLEVAFCELSSLPEEHLRHLAERRNVTADHIRGELEARAKIQAEARREAQDDYDARLDRLANVQRQVNRVEVVRRERNDPRIENPTELSAERREVLRQSSTALKTASADERAAFLDFLHSLESQYTSLQQKARAKLDSEFPAGKQYQELVQILGLASSNPAEHKRARDSLTTKLTRLLRRIRRKQREGGH